MFNSRIASLSRSSSPVVAPEAELSEAVEQLRRSNASCLVVASGATILGIATARSLLRALAANAMRPDGLRAADALAHGHKAQAPAHAAGRFQEEGTVLPLAPEAEACLLPDAQLSRQDLIQWIQLSSELSQQELLPLIKPTTKVSVRTPPAEALRAMLAENTQYLTVRTDAGNHAVFSATDCLGFLSGPDAALPRSFLEIQLAPTPAVDCTATVSEAWARIAVAPSGKLAATGTPEPGKAPELRGVVDKADLTQAMYGPLLNTLHRVLLSEQRTEQRYQAMFLNAGLGFFVTRWDGRFVNVNPAFARFMGYDSPEEMITTINDIADQLYVDAGKRLELLHRLHEDGEIHNFEFEAKRKDGSTCWLLVNASHDRNDTNRLNFFEGTVLDITDRKHYEQAQLTIQSTQAASEAKSELLRNMSHEIRTPLNALIGMADLLWSTELHDEQRKLLHVIINSGHFLLELINHILNMARMEANEFTPQEIPFDLVDLVEETCEIMSVRVHEKQLELYSHIAADVPQHLLGDPTCLRQILINLVGNAMKFTQNGFIEIRCTTAPKVPTEGADNVLFLHFSVRDTGIGIPKDKLETIFGIFTQADSSITRRFGGTGLGLSISQKLVQTMHGRIWAESESGAGSTFHFTAGLRLDQSPESKALADADIRGASVLLLDNNERSSRHLRNILQNWDVTVRETHTGDACIQCLEPHTEGSDFDAIIIDAQIPGREGYKTAFKIAKHYGMPDRVIMVFTPNTGSDNLSWVKEIGAAAYLFKPAKRKDLKRALLTAMKRLKRQSPETKPQERLLSNVRILCAEDNEYNRIIIENYLSDTPVVLEFAEDGAIAVEKCRRTAYDLILMDIQLPVIDGLTATRKIRELERTLHRPPAPILALTAHALEEEQEKSRRAGCDAHLTKPLLRETLLQAIRHYAGPAAGTIPPQAQESVPDEADSPETLVIGNPRLKKYIPGYLDSCKENLQNMRTGLANNDFTLLQRLGHSMKGSGAGYGFEPVTRLGATIETATEAGDIPAVRTALDALEKYLSTVKVIFDTHPDNTGGKAG